MKIRPVEAEWIHADRRTNGRPEMAKLVVAFRNFANGPKRFRVADGNGTYILCPICSFVRLMLYKPHIETQSEYMRLIHLQKLVNEVTDYHETWHGCHPTEATPPICRPSKCQINMKDVRKFYAASNAAFLESPKHTMDNRQCLL
jgi:hypothetical protein